MPVHHRVKDQEIVAPSAKMSVGTEIWRELIEPANAPDETTENAPAVINSFCASIGEKRLGDRVAGRAFVRGMTT
jgi:hypothetical protein